MDMNCHKNALHEKNQGNTAKDSGVCLRRGKGILYGNDPTPFRRYFAELLQGDYLTCSNHADDPGRKPPCKVDRTGQPVLVLRKARQVTKICIRCNKSFTVPAAHQDRRKHCSVLCCTLDRRLFEVSTEELYALVWSRPTTEVARLFGVSDKAIEKRCKRLGVPKPPRGYWLQIYRLQKRAQF